MSFMGFDVGHVSWALRFDMWDWWDQVSCPKEKKMRSGMWYIGCGYTHMGPELARNIPSRRSRWTAGLGSGQATIMSEAPRDHHSASWTWFHLLAGPFRFTHASGHRRAFVACNKHVGDCRRYAFISDFPSKHDIGAWMIAWGIIARDFPIEDSV